MTGGRSAARPRGLAYVLILNWNGWDDTALCLRSAESLNYPGFEVVIIDNGSTDGSEERLRRLYPNLVVLQTGRNLGYAGGHNVGIRHALSRGAQYIWILNNDVEFQPDSLSALVDVMESDARRGVLSSSLISPKGRQRQVSAWSGRVLARGATGPIECDGCEEGFHPAVDLMGASLFVRARLFEEVGLLDERYFHYYEERDFVERARRAGWSLGLACRSRILHEHGNTLSHGSPQSTYYLLRNKLLYEKRWHGLHPLKTASRNTSLIRTLVAPRRSIKSRDFRSGLATALAIIDAVRGRTGMRDLGPKFRKPVPWAES